MTFHPCEACSDVSFVKLFSKHGHDYFRCQSCGLTRLDSQPTDEMLAKIYGSHYYRAWGVETGADRVYELKKETFRRNVFKYINLPPGSLILDCGAAFGALMSAAKDKGWSPYGIELTHEAAEQIAIRFGSERVFSGPFEKAFFPSLQPGSFDAVFMCDFLEHVRNPESVLRKASEFLKPGGYLVITTPDGGSPSCRLMKRGWIHYKTEHLHYFNYKSIQILLGKIGLTTVEARSARKVLDFEYIRHQFNTYPRRGITPWINLITKVMGNRLRTVPISFSFGEMIVVAIKN